VVIHFLAALELVRRKEAVAVQRRLFDDIALERAEVGSDLKSRAG
jgi:chromatin segregation and condensation protein Rec8/ScpA/Scc1 (kleisin family)